MKSEFSPVEPRACPHKEDCLFYHSATYPDGSTIDGVWDIRGVFEQYIGNYPLKGKTVLDVGTATGFLAFEAERAGAASVTALDAFSASEFERVPFATIPHHLNRRAYDDQMEAWYGTLKNGFWYSWNKNRSSVEMIYAPLARLPYWERKFDVVIAGAILEHLADPVSAIGNLARLAREAVIIGFTPVADSDAQFMQTANDWGDPADPAKTYTFWTLTRGLYRRIFLNLGFTIELVPAVALLRGHGVDAQFPNGLQVQRFSIIARRSSGDLAKAGRELIEAQTQTSPPRH